MLGEARELSAIAPQVTVKIPMTLEGLKATRACFEAGIKTNVTLIFQPLQGLLAAKAGASFVSPFVGRQDDIATPGMDMVADLKAMLDNYGLATEIIVASVRHPIHVHQAAMLGAHIVTVPLKVLTGLIQHPLTDIGIRKFLEDARKIPKG
jgi:transaldolase